MSKFWIGIDNGVTGTITGISKNEVVHFKTPVKIELSYTKKKQYITRIDSEKLKSLLFNMCKGSCFCLLERPMINPMRFKQSISASRALEATLIVLEGLDIPRQYIDSKEWQDYFLPTNIIKLKSKKKSAQLKQAAVDIAKRLFPKIKTEDADSLLIAEYARRKRY